MKLLEKVRRLEEDNARLRALAITPAEARALIVKAAKHHPASVGLVELESALAKLWPISQSDGAVYRPYLGWIRQVPARS